MVKNVKKKTVSASYVAAANLKIDPGARERPQPKAPPGRATKMVRKKRIAAKEWKKNRTKRERQMDFAILTAADYYRRTQMEARGALPRRKPKVPGRKTRKRACAVKSLRPSNYAKLDALIPPAGRAKPTADGQEIIYLPHALAPQTQWTLAKVERLTQHKAQRSDWCIVEKPRLRFLGENPYLAIDSTNVWLAPIHHAFPVHLFPSRGVYVLSNVARGEFYVGESNDIPKREEKHANGTGAAFTKKWKGEFIRVPLLSLPGGTHKQREARETALLVGIHGIFKVMGAGKSSLSSSPRQSQS